MQASCGWLPPIGHRHQEPHRPTEHRAGKDAFDYDDAGGGPLDGGIPGGGGPGGRICMPPGGIGIMPGGIGGMPGMPGRMPIGGMPGMP